MNDFPYDGHIYSNTCGGRDSLTEMIRGAEAVGLELAVVAESLEARGLDVRDRVRAVVQAGVASTIKVAPALETAVLDPAGALSLPESIVGLTPLVYAYLGGRSVGIAIDPPASRTRYLSNIFTALHGAVENPAVTALARPFNTGQFPAPLTPGELPKSALDELAMAMFEKDVAFEISNRMHWWFPEQGVDEFTSEYAGLMGIFGRRNVKFIVSSDACGAEGVGNLRYVKRLMVAAGVEKSQVIDLPQYLRNR